LALVAFYARNVDWGQALATLRTSEPAYVIAALGIYYLSFPVRAIRWARLLRESGYRIRGSELLRILMLGWFVNCLVPAKLGDLYRSYLVKQKFGISLSRTVGVVVAERLLDLFVVFGLLVVDGYIAFGRTVLPDLNVPYATGAGLGVLLLVGLCVVYVLTAGFGLQQNQAIAVAVLDRAVSVFSVIIVGGVVYLRTQRSERIGGGW